MDKTSVDVWINEHQTEIQTMSREDWLKLDEALKRPVYRKFTDEQRYCFWKDKINEVMRSFEWSELEKNHLNLLLNTLSDNLKWFGDGGIENMEKDDKETSETFFYKWDEYAQGRCTYISGVCMDYDGPGTDRTNSAGNFIGSDCFYAVESFHCWNEIMN
jgi:hypothetical protein